MSDGTEVAITEGSRAEDVVVSDNNDVIASDTPSVEEPKVEESVVEDDSSSNTVDEPARSEESGSSDVVEPAPEPTPEPAPAPVEPEPEPTPEPTPVEPEPTPEPTPSMTDEEQLVAIGHWTFVRSNERTRNGVTYTSNTYEYTDPITGYTLLTSFKDGEWSGNFTAKSQEECYAIAEAHGLMGVSTRDFVYGL